LRVSIDDRAVIARACGGILIARDEGDEAVNEGVFANVAEGSHGATSSEML
jgi:hypothetical protein